MQKTKNTTQRQKKMQYELNWRRGLIREQNESSKEIKQNEKRQKKYIIDEDINLSKFFELTSSSDEIYKTGLSLHENRSETLLDYADDFRLNKLMIKRPVEHETQISF